jgi:hypothetical protein
VFARIVPEVLGYLDELGARPGIMVGWYEEPFDDGTVVLHAGFDIADQAVEAGESVRVVELPVVEVARSCIAARWMTWFSSTWLSFGGSTTAGSA